MEDILKAYPLIIEIPVAWGEMDALGHVNNIVYMRYFESGRVAYLNALGYMESVQERGIGPILASASCRYKLPLTYPDTVSLGVRVSHIESDRFTMSFAAVSHKHKRVAAEGDGVIVSYDYKNNCKIPLPEDIRSKILDMEADVQLA